MSERIVPVPKEFAAQANANREEYKKLYDESVKNPEAFWAAQAERLTWFKKWDKVLSHDFKNAKVSWFEGGKINASYNCLDRHLDGPLRNKAALIWEGDNPEESRTLTYQQLHREVCRASNTLKSLGIKKGDRVILYMPMIPELAISVLACARIGAVHSVVFGGFSPEALIGRIDDCKPSLIITSDIGFRGGRNIEMKKNVDAALERSEVKVNHVLVVRRESRENILHWVDGRDKWWHLLTREASGVCEAEWMDAEDPLFILYTSGSTGKPKGVLHTTGGYMLGASLTHHYVFDSKPEDT
ncbi:MAG: AMP-binding protein, partial [Spirochaetia bacterium]|nr:AMP-binding protein [Spirochaetia bacterium]